MWFYHPMSHWSFVEYLNFFKIDEILESERFGRKCHRNWVCQPHSQVNFLYFEVEIGALAQILRTLWQLKQLTYFCIWWCHRWHHLHQRVYTFPQQGYAFLLSAVLITLIVQPVSSTLQTNRQTEKHTNGQMIMPVISRLTDWLTDGQCNRYWNTDM